jgi:hypothetical protein
MKATNIFFSKLIKLDGRLREFNFRKATTSQNSFHVDVTDDRGHRIMFYMQKDGDGEWNTQLSTLPNWLHYATPFLNTAIKEKDLFKGLLK